MVHGDGYRLRLGKMLTLVTSLDAGKQMVGPAPVTSLMELLRAVKTEVGEEWLGLL